MDEVVAAALEHGCGFFDTAEGYNEGRSEESLGRALRGRREGAVIASKISPDHCTPGGVRRHCEASLERLGTDHVDLYMLHWPINPLSIKHFTADATLQSAPPGLSGALTEMEALRREGKVLHIGVSNFGPTQLGEAAACGVELVCDEVPYSLLARAVEWDLLPVCARAGLGVLGYMPLMQGLLTGKYRSGDELPPSRARTRHFRGDGPMSRHGEAGAERETFAAIERVRAIAGREGLTMESLAIAWSVARPEITCTITGARNPAQLGENARAAEQRLDPALVAELDAATEGLKAALGTSIDLYESSSSPRTR